MTHSSPNPDAAWGKIMNQVEEAAPSPEFVRRLEQEVIAAVRPAAARVRRRAWMTAAAAAVVLAAGGMLLLRVDPARAAMTRLSACLANLENFTASFIREWRYTDGQPGGFTVARAHGTFGCRLVPAPEIGGEETWTYTGPGGSAIPDMTETFRWRRAPDESRDVHESAAGRTESFFRDDAWPAALTANGIFDIADGESLLPPGPRRAAYELARMLRGFADEGYGRWFGKTWTQTDYRETSANESITFATASGAERWTLTVELGAGGRIGLALDQDVTDSAGVRRGSVRSRFDVTGINLAPGQRLFTPMENMIK